MNYPSWDLPLLGGGLLIGIVAILHVFVAHFAVGGGLFLVWTERLAYLREDRDLLGYVKSHTRFFVLVVLVTGAVTGVGIWWTISIVSPPGTSALIHTFVWGWAIEWVLFFVEIAAAFVYYYGWDRLDRATHLRVGWIYFVAAWLSLFVINGILTFMLTPGRWLASRSFLDGFANPSMLPSLVTRTAVAVALAGLYAILTAVAIESRELRHRVLRYAARWVLAGCAMIPFAGIWYISTIPPLAREISMGGAPAVTIFAGLSVALSIAVVLLTFFGPLRSPAQTGAVLAAVIGVLGLGVTGVTEWVREAVRKPYLIYGYMYSNGILVTDADRVRREGVLATAKWVSVERADGPEWRQAAYQIFRTECRACHTIDGYNGIRPLVKGWPESFLDRQLRNLDTLKGYMPPFLGTDVERTALARWLAELGGEKPFSYDLMRASKPAPPAGSAGGGS